MISITFSSFSQKCKVEVHREYIKIKSRPIIGRFFIQSFLVMAAFLCGLTIFVSNIFFFVIIMEIMLVIFMLVSMYTGRESVTMNPETRRIHITGWSEQRRIKWADGMNLSYERMFNESDKLSGIRLYLPDDKGLENTLVVFESENRFQEFVKVYNQRYPNEPISI